MKNIVKILVLILFLGVFGVGKAYAEQPAATVKSEFVMDYYTETIIHESNADKKLPIASMVKIMTALLAFEKVDNGEISLEQKVAVSPNAESMGGSQMFLEAGDEYTVSDLLKGIIVVSANDASVQIAELIAGSESKFVEMMNARAKELGMTNTVFVNATGLPAGGQYSTARDVAIMLKELSKHEKYYDYSKIWIENFNHPDGRVTEFVNTNKLIRFNRDCEGGKTGFTQEAKFCLATTAKRDETRLICVVIGADTSKNRFARATELLNEGFSSYVNSKVVSKDVKYENEIKILGGKEKTIFAYPDRDLFVFRSKNEAQNFEVDFEIFETLRAPIKKGDTVGRVVVNSNGKTQTANLVADRDVDKKSLLDAIKDLFRTW